MSGRKKVLLMGKSGSGKSSMRHVIFKGQLASDTRRLGATIDVESSQIKFLGGLRLDLWDCGGQDTFMDSHLTSQSSTVFRGVNSLIYIFDAESPDLTSSDTHYFLKCLTALRDQTVNQGDALSAASNNLKKTPSVFVLLHKMDLVPVENQQSKLADFSAEVTKRASESGWKGRIETYGTSIWNESLYKAWSAIMSQMMPALTNLRKHLAAFAEAIDAREVVLFERTTFLVIASLSVDKAAPAEWDDRRYERISTMVKGFKLGCSKLRATFTSLSVSTHVYSAVLDALTPETYILVISNVETPSSAIELNIRNARPHFAQLEEMGMGK